ncbi:MAG TPA: DUF1036 domain-containing protein [Aestuariivirgaceae bacterium]|jgi:uncharacterized membrane protein|nr:DUF1036 domain-containing protein [Aestuariivirgaceae bacterium]
MNTFLTALCGTVLLLTLGAAPVAADLKLCNNTDSRVGVALGYKDMKGWASEGWWNIDPNACETLLQGPLIARYYYIFAVDYDKGGSWSGEAIMCTRDTVFTIRGLRNCQEQGYQQTGFFEVDTKEETDWTVSLSGVKTSDQQAQ